MKALFLLKNPLIKVGGVENHVRSINRYFKNLDVTILSESDIFTSPINEHNKKWVIWRWLWQHRELIEQADIIHCHDVFYWFLPFRLIYPKKKVYITFHGWEGVYPPTIKAIWVRKISEWLSNGNICVGGFISKWYGTKPTYITYGGVDLPEEESKTTPEIKYPYLYIGRLDNDTGLDIYLEAARLAREKDKRFALSFLGDGVNRDYASKWGTVLGFHDNVNRYLDHSRCVFTSGYLSMLEAISRKRLVFAVYNNPLKEDYLKMSPFKDLVVICNSGQELLEKIEFYESNEKLTNQLIDRAYAWAKEQSWDKVAGIYKQLWGI